MSRADDSRSAERASDAVPLSRRVVAMAGVRAGLLGVLLTVAVVTGVADAGQLALTAAAHLALTSLLGLTVLSGRRRVSIAAIGATHLLDVVVLGVLAVDVSRGAGGGLVVGAYLVAVSLLASFRTGIKLAVWSTIVSLLLHEAVASGLIDQAEKVSTSRFVADQALVWVLVLVTCTAAAVSERELRRRRLDAEALRAFAAGLHAAEDTSQVARRVAAFLADELDATRVCVARRGPRGLEALAGVGLRRVGAGDRSALLDLVAQTQDLVLALRLDAGLDPWLAAVLPGARRLLVLPLALRDDEQVVVVVEHGRTRGRRVDRRFVAGAEQAVATASLAFSRAVLLEQARAAASTDSLTGLANRRVFDDSLRAMVHAYRTRGEPGGLVITDVDRFKSINDTHGHPVGDEVLRVLAGTLRAAAGPGALVARYGGEEFCILLPGLDTEQAAEVAEGCRAAVEQMVAAGLAVTASFGVAALPDQAHEAEALVSAADEALIRAKIGGRNRVVLAEARTDYVT